MKNNYLAILIFIAISYTNNLFAAATFEKAKNLGSNSDGNNHDTRAYRGITFNSDGTKMYLSLSKTGNTADSGVDDIASWNLSTPFDIATASFTGNMEGIRNKCDQNSNGFLMQPFDFRFNNDGTKMFIANGVNNSNGNDVCQFNLSTPYDISTFTEVDENDVESNGFEINANYEGKPETDVDDASDGVHGLAFNSDGTKLFLTSNTHHSGLSKVYEFDVTTAFELTTASYTNKSYDINANGGLDDTGGLQFSKDGKQMFIVESDDYEIHQWSLSSGFDLSSTITYRGSYDMTAHYTDQVDSITNTEAKSLEFNNDGSKLYVTFSYWKDNTKKSDREYILQYGLDCPYGVVYCESPVSGSDKDMIGVLESYTEMSKRVMKNNIKPVMHRLEWLRRHRKEDNLTNQNIQFNFSNEMLSSLAKVIPIGTNQSETNNEEQQSDWFFWSEGQINIGDIEATSGSSRKEIDTSGITVGADKKVSENKMYGYALQFGRDSADIGNSAAILDTDNYSLVFYGTLPYEDGRFLDAALGVSTLKTLHLRKKHSVNLNGKRDGRQVFGSIKLNKIYNKKNININPTARVDLGFTELANFQESGSVEALIYEKHQIPKGFANLGMVFDTSKKFDNGSILKPMGRLEYIADFSPSTNTNVSYLSNPSTDHFIRIGNQSTHNYKAGLGFDLSTVTGWSVILNYEIDSTNGSGHSDNLSFTAGWVPNRNTEYSISLKNQDKLGTRMSIAKNIDGFDLKLDLDYDFFKEKSEQNMSIFLNKSF